MKHITFSDWTLLGTLPYQAEFSVGLQQGENLPYLVPPVPAKVPGCVYDDLWRAGIIENPYVDLNSLNCEWVANRWWIYRTDFVLEQDDLRKDLLLTLNGVDYQATVYVNGRKVGSHEGMYLPFTARVNDFVTAGENKLVIVLENAPASFGQAGYTSQTHYLKARFNYKWDFAGRIVSLGLYDTVTLTAHEGMTLGDTLIQTRCEGMPVEGCTFSVAVTQYLQTYMAGEYRVVLRWEGKVIAEQLLSLQPGESACDFTFAVPDARLWWPNGSGDQPLYALDIAVYCGDVQSDEKHKRVGLRTMEHEKPVGREDALEYQIVVNGKKIYRKGTNMVPLTCLTGALTDEELTRTLTAARDAGINFLRIWGGGHFESEAFYDLCDEYGLMVLQEFPQSSSGCDDLPSRDEHFLALLEKAIPGQIRRIASHAAFCEFDGGNEMENLNYAHQPDHEMYAATFEDPILAKFKGWVDTYAPGAYMLPSSGSGYNTIYRKGESERNHDVHGPWVYMGPVEHYTLYNDTDCIVHGEFGCGGITNLESLKEFVSEEHLRFNRPQEDAVWYHHGGSWSGYETVLHPMFGDLSGIPFADWIMVSQYMQYEGLRYALERHRSKAWRTVGTMTWQFNEPWPNAECSNVYDFYGRKKLGYYALKEAYAPVTVSLAYDKLFWNAGDVFEGRLTAVNDFAADYAELSVSVVSLDGRVYQIKQFAGQVAENAPTALGNIQWTVPDGVSGGFMVRISGTIGQTAVEKEYLMLIADIAGEFEPAGANPVANMAAQQCFYGSYADWRVVAAYAKKLREKYIE